MKSIKFIIYISIFLITFGFFNHADAATEVIRTIKPSGQGGDYTSLAAWEVGEQRDLVAADEIAVAQIDGNWTTPDTTAVTINGWTTDATRYIKIYTTEQARHSGKWENTKYRLESSDWALLYIADKYVIVDGLQLYNAKTTTDSNVIVVDTEGRGGVSDSKISNNIVRGNAPSTDSHTGIFIGSADAASTAQVWNNIIYDIGTYSSLAVSGIRHHGSVWDVYAYNNTIINIPTGIRGHGDNPPLLKNNIVQGASDGYYLAYGSWDSGTDYNISNLSSDAPSLSYRSSLATTVTFASGATDDFHLNSTDTGAKNFGADLTNDANLPFNTDIDGYVRNQVWDIGADEVGGNTRVIFSPDPGQETNFGAATAIYRSVGPGNTTAVAVGTSNTLTITGSTATFSSPLPDRIGVGDALQYDANNNGSIDSIVFIHSRTSSKSFTVKNSYGGAPTAVASDNDWSILRAYTSLSLAETGTENTGINVNVRDFDTWSGGKDLTSSNEVRNIACYGDAPDTTAVTIDGWTTDADNYIRIYTPVSKEEVGVSQRHRGKWDAVGYRLEVGADSEVFRTYIGYIKIDGIQFKKTHVSNNNDFIILTTTNVVDIANCIVWRPSSAGSGRFAMFGQDRKLNVINTVIYGGGFSHIFFDNWYDATLNVYGSTFVGASGSVFYRAGGGTWIVKNSYGQSTGAVFNGSVTQTTCASSDNTASGTSLDNIAVDILNFSNVASGSEDYHIKLNSALKDVGTNTSGDTAPFNFTTDIDGQTRVGSWDIGADEKPANTVIKGGVRITK